MRAETIECMACGWCMNRAAHEYRRAPGDPLHGICGRCASAGKRRAREVYRVKPTPAAAAMAALDRTNYRCARAENRPSLAPTHKCFACASAYRLTSRRESHIVHLCGTCLHRGRCCARYHAHAVPSDAEVLTVVARREGIIRGIAPGALLEAWLGAGIMRPVALRKVA